MPRLFCVVAHPDDETILTGGLLAWATFVRGAEVYVACATRGEGGEVGEPPLTTREHLPEVRAQEMQRAVQALGVRELIFLGYVDALFGRNRGQPMVTDPLEFEWKVVSLLRELKPDVVVTHGTNGEYGHPQHRQVNEFTTRAFFSAHDPFRFPDAGPLFSPKKLYYFAASPRPGAVSNLRFPNQSDRANFTLDVTPVLDRKLAAAECHRTQLALFMRRAGPPSLRERLINPEPLHRAWPPGDDEEHDLFE